MLYVEKSKELLQREWEQLHARYHQITGIHLFRAEALYALETLCNENRKCSLQAILVFQLRYGLEDGVLRHYSEIAEDLEISENMARTHSQRVASCLHYRRAREALEVERQLRRVKYDKRNKRDAEKRQRAVIARYG